MKKIVLSLAAVMAAATFAPEASALPVFARQTGMACNACHFQHFPMLNTFGRAFKASGFTLIGAQGKIEGTQNTSLPDTLNTGFLTSLGYEKTNMSPDTTGLSKNTGNGYVFLPGVAGEASLFFGGRVSDNAGFLSEVALAPTAGLDSAKLPILYSVGGQGVRVGVVPFATNAQGASYGMELLNTGANAVQQMSNTPGFNSEHTMAISAQQFISTSGRADGAAFVATSDMGFLNLTKYQQSGIDQGAGASLGSTYLRVAGTLALGGWDAGLGIQSWSGQSWDGAALALIQTKATAIDGQMQGMLGEMPTGFYFSYAKAPKSDAGGLINAYSVDPNAGVTGVGATLDRSSFNIDAEVGVVPEVLTVGAAIRRGKSGVADAVTGENLTDNAIYLTTTYKVSQNMLARLSYTTQSGGYWNAANTNAVGSKTTTINLYTLF